MNEFRLLNPFDPITREKYAREKARDAAAKRRHEKQIQRLVRFAMKLDPEMLAILFASRSQLLVMVKRTLSIKSESFDIVSLRDRINAIRAERFAEQSQNLFKLIEKNRNDRKKGAQTRHQKDAKQQAKSEAKKLWHEWKLGKHPRIRTVEQFAAETLRKWPVLTSATVICKWSAQWARDAKSGQPC